MKDSEDEFIEGFLEFIAPKSKWGKWQLRRYEKSLPRRKRWNKRKLHVRTRYILPAYFVVAPKVFIIHPTLHAHVEIIAPWFSRDGEPYYVFYSRHFNEFRVASTSYIKESYKTRSWQKALHCMHETREQFQQEKAQRELDFLLSQKRGDNQ